VYTIELVFRPGSSPSVSATPVERGWSYELTGFDVTPEELGYFMIFGTMNIAVPITSAVKRRVTKEHTQFMHLYLLQPSVPTLVAFTKLLGYPGANPETAVETDPATIETEGANA
jgi:hypothetical protein